MFSKLNQWIKILFIVCAVAFYYVVIKPILSAIWWSGVGIKSLFKLKRNRL